MLSSGLKIDFPPAISIINGEHMDAAHVLLFREDDGTTPFLEWYDGLHKRVRYKYFAKLKLLEDKGHRLTRPHADYLRDEIYELRIRVDRVHHRILYFFGSRGAVVLSHGLVKEGKVPDREIELAIRRKRLYDLEPEGRAFKWEIRR
jgi:phage-related protein